MYVRIECQAGKAKPRWRARPRAIEAKVTCVQMVSFFTLQLHSSLVLPAPQHPQLAIMCFDQTVLSRPSRRRFGMRQRKEVGRAQHTIGGLRLTFEITNIARQRSVSDSYA